MKKLFTLFAAIIITFSALQSSAQGNSSNGNAFDKSTKMLTISVGAADMFHIPLGYNYYSNFYLPLTGEVALEGEFAIHKYVGLGFNFGLGGRLGSDGYNNNGLGVYGTGYGYRSEFNVNASFIANFHFYQLIADKVHKNIHGDKLDVYAGLSIGSGLAIHPSDGYYASGVDALFFVGPQVGARYFFNDVFGVNAEAGLGKTLVRAGVSFKLGAKRNKAAKK